MIRKFFAEVVFLDLFPLSKTFLILKVKPYTLLSFKRLSFLYELARTLNLNKVAGDFVECGSWNGGSGAMISSLAVDKKVWLLDSWEGMPEAGVEDIKIKSKKVIGEKGMALSSFEKAKYLLFGKLKLSPDNVLLIKGWFEDTVPALKDKIDKISLLHLDCDWYESVKICLENFYDKVTFGGFVVVDDYESWLGSKKAVDEFLRERES